MNTAAQNQRPLLTSLYDQVSWFGRPIVRSFRDETNYSDTGCAQFAAVQSGDQGRFHLYVSGMAGIDPKTNQLAGSPIQEQARQALLNCQNILRAADATLDDVVWMASVQTTSKGLALALAVQPLESWRETLAVS